MTRYTVALRHSPKGWEWNYLKRGWWGFCDSHNRVKRAAKRSIARDKTGPKDWTFVYVKHHGGRHDIQGPILLSR